MKKGKTFEVSGEIYQLRISINALCKIEDILGYPMTEIEAHGMGIKEMRVIMTCGLIPSVSMEEAGDIMDILLEEKGADGFMNLMLEAMQSAMGSSKDVVPSKVAKAKKK